MIARFLEMGIEPYQVSNALYGVVSQRLLRRQNAEGGYRGRVPVGEFVVIAVSPPKNPLPQR